MTHIFALGLLAGEAAAPGGPDLAGLADLVGHGVRSLTADFHDARFGGWFSAVTPQGPVDAGKQAYGHAFVVLAASSAAASGAPGAHDLLNEALAVQDGRFWQEGPGLVVDAWDRTWSQMDPYRGINANMHTVEAYLAAGDVTGDERWHARAGRIAATVATWAGRNAWRIPEHFDAGWRPLLEHNRDRPAHPFQPYGATVGHGLEWARLLVAVDASLVSPPAGLVEAAVELADRAVADGWSVDGPPGFVYTTDWDGVPVVRARMHWVVAEAICTAEALRRATGQERFVQMRDTWWRFADEYLVDHVRGSWHHELDASNVPSGHTWPGKPDVYHAYQAALSSVVPTSPSFATALVRGMWSPDP
jgi:mannose/cellobiose epimerase-like protein (N-acyl-D-glucosamine 2-epimerase family)